MDRGWQTFIEEAYEIAFGDNAFNRGFDAEEVLVQLREFSDNALKWEEFKQGESTLLHGVTKLYLLYTNNNIKSN